MYAEIYGEMWLAESQLLYILSVSTKDVTCYIKWKHVFEFIFESANHSCSRWYSVVCLSVFSFQNNLSKYQWISPNLVCALILWKYGSVGIANGKFLPFLTELPACHMIVAGYYHITFIPRYIWYTLWCLLKYFVFFLPLS